MCPVGLEALAFVHRICRGLSASPGEDRICRDLVLDLPERFSAGAAVLAQLRDDGAVHVTGQFGYPGRDTFPSSFPLNEDWPLIRALRQPDPLVLRSAGTVLERFPLVGVSTDSPRAFAATQLTFGGSPVGVLGISFESPVADVEGITVLLRTVRDVVGLYVGSAWDRDAETMHPVGRRADDEELTPRQLTILHLLGEGMGNAQIAFRIGFSESTVRQEAMSIYRSLGVADRHSAVNVARARGILPDTAPTDA
jgi:DNA-binding CsgD family transcriptional regulator